MSRLGRTVVWLLAFAGTAQAADDSFEVTPAPLVGGSSDVGFGGGVLASLARVSPGHDPYLHRLELAGIITFRPEGGQLAIPFQDYYLLLDVPELLEPHFGLKLRVSYTREATSKYYGLGNASRLPPGRSLDDDYFEYDRIHPTLLALTEQRLGGSLVLELGASYTHNWLEVPADGKLSNDRDSGDRLLGDRLATFADHGVMTFSYGIATDTRDHRVMPTRGQYHSLRFDWSPGGSRLFSHRWERLTLVLRGYLPVTGGVGLALRGAASFLFHDPPFYELARFESSGALGGPKGVRGVPGQRYHGMITILGNAELRAALFDFRFLGKNNTFMAAAFADGGRVWAAYERRADLDGSDIGLKYGLGGGPRLLAGKSFVLRGDVAWSPDAKPVSAYIASGHVF